MAMAGGGVNVDCGQARGEVTFETGTVPPGDGLVGQSKNLEPQMNADKRK
jgi:hypothetical protein